MWLGIDTYQLVRLADQRLGRPTSVTAATGRDDKKDAGPEGPASQTGRLHVWETWDHEDPEFRTRSAETFRVENLRETTASDRECERPCFGH